MMALMRDAMDSDVATSSTNSTLAKTQPPVRVAHVIKFSAHLVLLDPETKRLRQSPHLGKLVVNTTDQLVSFAYNKGNSGQYGRKLQKPHKCIVAEYGIKIWSSVSTCSVMCRFGSKDDKECCLEALQIMGVRVIDISPERLTQQEKEQEPAQRDESVYDDDLCALHTVLANPRRSHEAVSFVSSYSASPQLASDIAVISRAFFDRA